MVRDACCRPPITIRSHDLHVGDIKSVVGEKGLVLSLFLVITGRASFGFSLAFPFCLMYDGSDHRSFIGFLFVSCVVQVHVLKQTNVIH